MELQMRATQHEAAPVPPHRRQLDTLLGPKG